MKKLPRSIRILGRRVRIQWVEKLEADGEELSGDCDSDAAVIRISLAANKTAANKRATLLHEVMHLIVAWSGHRDMLGPEREEGLVTALENGLRPLIRFKAP